MAKALMGLGFYRDAERAAARAGELGAADWRPPLLRGRLRAAQRDWAGASAYLSRAIELGPERFEGYLERAKVQAALGNLEGAIENYRLAMRWLGEKALPERDAIVMGLLGAYVQEGRIDDALLLLLEQLENLAPISVENIRSAPRFGPLQKDARFDEVLGLPPPSSQEAPGGVSAPASGGLMSRQDRFPAADKVRPIDASARK